MKPNVPNAAVRETPEALWGQAQTHLAKGANAAAGAVAQRFVVAFPGDPRGVVLQARVQAAQSGPAAGEQLLASAPDALKDRPEVLAWRARLLWEAGDAAAATRMLERVGPQADPSDVVLWTRARLARARKDNAAACADLVVLTRQAPEDLDSWRLLGAVLMDLGKPAVAVMALEYALSHNRQDVPTWAALVQAHLGAGNVAQSFACVQDGVKQHPKAPTLLTLANQLRALNTATGTDVQARIVQAQLMMDCGDVAGAQAVVDALKRQYPTSRSVGFLEQEVSVARTPDAQVPTLLADVSRQATHQAALLEPKLILLQVLQRKSPVKNHAQSLLLAEQAWAMAPGHPHVGFLLVRALALTGRTSHARVLAQQLVVHAPTLREPLARVTG